MATPKSKLGDLLISLRLIRPNQLAAAIKAQESSKLPLGAQLVAMGAIEEEMLLNAMSSVLGVWPWRLDRDKPSALATSKLPAEICRHRKMLPVAVRGDLLVVAMMNPHDREALEEARDAAGMRVEAVLADAKRLLDSIESIYGEHAELQNIDHVVDRALLDFNVEREAPSRTAKLDERDARPVVELVNQTLSEAIRDGASDVHFEPRANRVEIRFRVDGRMRLKRTVPAGLLPMLVTRIKIMSELDIVEFRVPQDGRITVSVDEREVDLRVSVIPNQHGQRIVLRILDRGLSLRGLDEVGIWKDDLNVFRRLTRLPHGIILVTGPTGSGKTTTLYAAIKDIQSQEANVMTVEDPIEYDLDGVNQSQINEKVGLTFAKQLRAILRQDPDVILVGEIRDAETATTAIQASLTGHLVLSTLHCNDALSSVPRLLDMGVEPYLLSTSLIGVTAQRLFRTLCPKCKRGRGIWAEEADVFKRCGIVPPMQLFEPVGCAYCESTGFRGRQAAHEVLTVGLEIAEAIAARMPYAQTRRLAAREGFQSMQNAALLHVAAGVSTLTEVARVIAIDAPMDERSSATLQAA